MNYINNSVNWEEFFIQEAVELEERMKDLDTDSLNKSKLRICLEHNILEWPDYERWYSSRLGCSSLKMSMTDEDIEKFIDSAKMNKETYSNYDFWNEDLIPFISWDDQIIILGIQYNEKLVALENHIFILTPPHILSYITLRLHNENMMSSENNENLDLAEESKSMTKSILDGINFDIGKPEINFNSQEMVSVFGQSAKDESNPEPIETNTPKNITNGFKDKNDSVWEVISEKHSEFDYEVKKQFEAFVVLKINQNKTNVFKMDANLAKRGISNLIFEYSMTAQGPFKKVYETGKSDTFSLKDLSMKLDPFEHTCITPIKRGKNTIGFFVGFKTDTPSRVDQLLLDEIATESIAS